MANKIKYGIKNVHYAPITTSGFGTPVPLPGAKSISLSPEGDRNVFYADNIEYYVVNVNNGYSGDLELALIPDTFREDVLGEFIGTDGVCFEFADGGEAIPFALGFEIEGDANSTLFWFYNCTAKRPETKGETKEDNITPQTETINISCKPQADGMVRAKTTDTTTSTIISGWFTSVYTG